MKIIVNEKELILISMSNTPNKNKNLFNINSGSKLLIKDKYIKSIEKKYEKNINNILSLDSNTKTLIRKPKNTTLREKPIYEFKRVNNNLNPYNIGFKNINNRPYSLYNSKKLRDINIRRHIQIKNLKLESNIRQGNFKKLYIEKKIEKIQANKLESNHLLPFKEKIQYKSLLNKNNNSLLKTEKHIIKSQEPITTTLSDLKKKHMICSNSNNIIKLKQSRDIPIFDEFQKYNRNKFFNQSFNNAIKTSKDITVNKEAKTKNYEVTLNSYKFKTNTNYKLGNKVIKFIHKKNISIKKKNKIPHIKFIKITKNISKLGITQATQITDKYLKDNISKSDNLALQGSQKTFNSIIRANKITHTTIKTIKTFKSIRTTKKTTSTIKKHKPPKIIKFNNNLYKLNPGKILNKKKLISKPLNIILVKANVKLAFIISFVLFASAMLSTLNIMPTLTQVTVLADESTIHSYKNELDSLDEKFTNEIEDYLNDGKYEYSEITYFNDKGSTQYVSENWKELLCILAVAMKQNLEISNDCYEMLNQIYELMNHYTINESIHVHEGGCQCSGDHYDAEGNSYYCSGCYCPGHPKVVIYVYNQGMEETMTDLNFDEEEKEWARRLAQSDFGDIYPDIGLSDSSSELTQDNIDEIISNSTTTAKREKIVETALSLVGKVDYFWGGKSPAGWNDKWGNLVLVTAPGDYTTGTRQPYGLDCSGFTDWVYKTAIGISIANGGSASQWYNTYAIEPNKVLPGDLVFMQQPNSTGVNHVGIYIGKDNATGKNLYVHCAGSGQGVVVNSFSGFKYFRRLPINFE